MRGLLKVILLTIINAKTPETAIKAVRWEVNKDPKEFGWVKEEGLKIEEIVERFQKHHKQISRYFSSGFGITLQNSDSRMAELVIKDFTSRGIPILCVHDSFVVQEKYEDDMWKVMENAWELMFLRATKIQKGSKSKIKMKKLAKNIPVKTRAMLDIMSRVNEDGTENFRNHLYTGERGSLRKPSPLDPTKSYDLFTEQNYTEKLIHPDQTYERRWASHQAREWEEVYFREE